MKKPYNIYCFMLLFTDNTCYFYRCAAHSKSKAYQKMIIELTHDTNMLRVHNLNTIRLLHVIENSDNDARFRQGLMIAAHKYHNFVHNYHYGMMQQYYYLNTCCIHHKWDDTCYFKHKSCCMNNGIYCKDYCKVGDYK